MDRHLQFFAQHGHLHILARFDSMVADLRLVPPVGAGSSTDAITDVGTDANGSRYASDGATTDASTERTTDSTDGVRTVGSDEPASSVSGFRPRLRGEPAPGVE